MATMAAYAGATSVFLVWSLDLVPFSYRKVGGLRFLRIGSLQISVCRTRKPCR